MNVEDIASQISVVFGIEPDCRDQISGAHVSPGSAETLARGSRITNHHLIVFSLSNISAKNYQNRLMCVEVIVCYISVIFLNTVQLGFREASIISYKLNSKTSENCSSEMYYMFIQSNTNINRPTFPYFCNKTANIVTTNLKPVSFNCKSHYYKTAKIKKHRT